MHLVSLHFCFYFVFATAVFFYICYWRRGYITVSKWWKMDGLGGLNKMLLHFPRSLVVFLFCCWCFGIFLADVSEVLWMQGRGATDGGLALVSTTPAGPGSQRKRAEGRCRVGLMEWDGRRE